MYSADGTLKCHRSQFCESLAGLLDTQNEEANLERSIHAVRARATRSFELIVVDGGSTDRTREIAKKCGAKVVESERGRGLQLRRGAEAATGDVLLFLHADTQLPDRYDDRILSSIAASSPTSSQPTSPNEGARGTAGAQRCSMAWGSFRDLKINASEKYIWNPWVLFCRLSEK